MGFTYLKIYLGKSGKGTKRKEDSGKRKNK